MGEIAMKVAIKCRIVFSIGGKGGVGKSWLIGLLAQWLEIKEAKFCLFDGDDETSTTSRFFPNAQFLAIRSSTEIDQLVQTAISGVYSIILVDLPARAGEEFQDWFRIVPWDELASMGIRLSALGVVSGAKDSIECILRWHEFLGDNVDYVIALNRRDNLDIYFSSNARQQFKAIGIPEIEIPKLDERLGTALDRASWTITSSLSKIEPHLLSQLMTRARLRRYRDQAFSQFNTIQLLIIP
jgi:hypothetical protein